MQDVTDPDRWQELKVDYKKASTGDRYGWYFDLPDKGERVVTDARYRGGLVFFNTLVPTDPRPCAAGGTGWMMSVDALTGGAPIAPGFDFDEDGVVQVEVIRPRLVTTAGLRKICRLFGKTI